jgi:ribosomal protein S18 acetylase RimI-like enzyme
MIKEIDNDLELEQVYDLANVVFEGKISSTYFRDFDIAILSSENGEIDGFISWYQEVDHLEYLNYETNNNINIHITCIGVAEKARNRGIATRLMNYVINKFHNCAKRYMLHVSVNNNVAINLYNKLNFHTDFFEMDYYEDDGYGIYTGYGVNAYRMTLLNKSNEQIDGQIDGQIDETISLN